MAWKRCGGRLIRCFESFYFRECVLINDMRDERYIFMNDYQQVEAHFERLNHLQGINAVLHWDSATMMPEGGAEYYETIFCAL